MDSWVAGRKLAGGLVSFAMLSVCLLSPNAASAHAALPSTASFTPVGEPTSTPYGWADFCRRYQGECDGAPLEPVDIVAASKTSKEIERVNKWVNDHVTPVTDMEHWGVVDQWDYPTDGKGDCEDFALMKRKILLEEGFPRQALLMTVVKDSSNEGHAVLTIKMSDGDFVLDNLSGEMKPWDKTGYRFVKRQSQSDQNVWVQLGDPTPAPDYVSR
ncbi:Transglutaminase family protein cysteine peptidase BTLCP [Methylocella tundrae]|uniref:Transglutaminase family protein cysteine peptidase BTLCP n=1 Tax=Methylocella tundrae TaxID=227605 RepID=A0A8B6MAZ7_METTU|nr:transglutaminase-like cysteine peptidase [Methylocella tundrae]VTZ51449.1 Transglutaminase family protein cysteine peptidase BTLCP [Methylocella tundrae]